MLDLFFLIIKFKKQAGKQKQKENNVAFLRQWYIGALFEKKHLKNVFVQVAFFSLLNLNTSKQTIRKQFSLPKQWYIGALFNNKKNSKNCCLSCLESSFFLQSHLKIQQQGTSTEVAIYGTDGWNIFVYRLWAILNRN